MCDDAVVIEAVNTDNTTCNGVDDDCDDLIKGGDDDSSDSILPGFSLIITMCALLSAVAVRRRTDR